MSTEALKLALEALEAHADIGIKSDKAITAIKQALASPVQEPVAQTFGEENVELGVYSGDASNGQQRELVGKVEMGQLVGDRPHKSASNPDTKGEIAVIRVVDEYGPMIDWYEHWVNFPAGTKLYTTPPAAPVHEPVAICQVYPLRGNESIPTTRIEWIGGKPVAGPLYTTPPAAHVQQKPLFTDIIAQHPGLAEELKAMDAAPVQEPSPFGILFAVEQAIKNGDCPMEIEIAFDAYETERMDIAPAQEPDHFPDATKMVAAQPEPDELTIAYMSGLYDGKKHAAQREWVGLTDEDVTWLCNTAKSHDQTWGMFVRTIEAKLKAKNHG